MGILSAVQAWRVTGRWERSEQDEPVWMGFWFYDQKTGDVFWASTRQLAAPTEDADYEIELPIILADDIMAAGSIVQKMIGKQLGPELLEGYPAG
jgi:hypothetical protein